MKAILVDDEERGIDVLQELLHRYCPQVAVAGAATDINLAAVLIRQHKPDVVFLDIAMPGGSGFQLLDMFDQPDFKVIFVTAHQEHALKALKMSALDYLLKPVNVRELQLAVGKLTTDGPGHSDVMLQHFKESWGRGTPFSKIVLSDLSGHHFVNIVDIIYCEADENYTHFHMPGRRVHTVSKALKEYAELLLPYRFFRIHKSYLVNLDHIVSVSKDFQVIMSNGEALPLSLRKRVMFFGLLKELRLM